MTGIKPGVMKKEKSDKIYPKVRIDLQHLPEAKKWDIGKSYKIEMEVKMVGISISKYDNSAEFEIRKIGSEDVGETEAEEKAEGDESDSDDSE